MQRVLDFVHCQCALHATLDEFFSARKSRSFLSQDDQWQHITSRITIFPTNAFKFYLKASRQGPEGSESEEIMDENISSFSTNFKTSGSHVKSTTSRRQQVVFMKSIMQQSQCRPVQDLRPCPLTGAGLAHNLIKSPIRIWKIAETPSATFYGHMN